MNMNREDGPLSKGVEEAMAAFEPDFALPHPVNIQKARFLARALQVRGGDLQTGNVPLSVELRRRSVTRNLRRLTDRINVLCP